MRENPVQAQHKQKNPKYKHFCKFAFDIQKQLLNHPNASESIEFTTINNKNDQINHLYNCGIVFTFNRISTRPRWN